MKEISTIKLLLIISLILSCVIYAQNDINSDKKYYSGYKKTLNEILKNRNKEYKLRNDVIPDSITAIKVAEIILANVYGKENIESQKPFKAMLVEGYWIVNGYIAPDIEGGVATIYIKKSTGEVLTIFHGK